MEQNLKSHKLRTRPVKHTLTSLLRMVKVNPLLAQGDGSSIKDKLPLEKIQRSQSLKLPSRSKPMVSSGVAASSTMKNFHNIGKRNYARTFENKAKITSKLQTTKETGTNKKTATATIMKELIKERVHLQPLNAIDDNNVNEAQTPKKPVDSEVQGNDVSEANTNTVFKTPLAYKRRSIAFFTPNTTHKVSYTPLTSTPGPNPDDLKIRLEKWLKSRGKSLGGYDHLKCFGINHDILTKNEENKENIERNNADAEGSYEDLRITPPAEPKETDKNHLEMDLRQIARDALKDLRKLMSEGYPKEQCEAWLGTIRSKYKEMEDEPYYWECLAALEETKGNIGSAVEYYKAAIVHGAEVNSVDECLEHLLEKFSLLNISSSITDNNDKSKNDRERIILDARNAFKSSIIQFAVQERKIKKAHKTTNQEETDKKLITPVRRSARLSRSYTQPNKEVFNSVGEAQDSFQGDVVFKGNSALASKYAL